MALAHWNSKEKMDFIIQFHKKEMSISNFSNYRKKVGDSFSLDDKPIAGLCEIKSSAKKYAFLAEDLQNDGIELFR